MRWVLLLALIASCDTPMTDRKYCTKKQIAWEEAFPEVKQTDTARDKFITDCLAAIPEQRTSGRLDRSIRCMDEHLRGHGHAHEQYLAFIQCEEQR